MAIAIAAPLPGWAPSDQLQGFVELAVPELKLEAEGPRHEAHGLGTHVRLIPDEPADLAALFEAVSAVEGVKASVVEGAIELEHADPASVLEAPFGEGAVGDAARMEAVVEAKEPTPQVLVVHNVSSARAVVLVEGVELGVVGPYTRAVVRDVPEGRYDVHFRLPNGYVRKTRVATVREATPGTPLRMRGAGP